MKKNTKMALSFLLTFILLFLPFTMLKTVTFAKLDGYNVGDTLYFGSYPQEKVEDRNLIYKFLSQDIDWKTKYKYEYYRISDVSTISVIQCTTDFLYADFEYNDTKYRLVSYEGPSDKSPSYYLFRFAPIEWQVLDPVNGLVASKQILDRQYYSTDFPQEAVPFSGYGTKSERTIQFENQILISCKYANSYIRNWLNNDFYHTAFSDTEMKKIKETTLNNQKYDRSLSEADSENTIDNVFLLSFDDMINVNYGFDFSQSYLDENRTAINSQYASFYNGRFHETQTRRYALRGADTADDNVVSQSYSSFTMGKAEQSYIRPAITLSDLTFNNNNTTKDLPTSVNESNIETSYSNNNYAAPIIIVFVSCIMVVTVIVIIVKKRKSC